MEVAEQFLKRVIEVELEEAEHRRRDMN